MLKADIVLFKLINLTKYAAYFLVLNKKGRAEIIMLHFLIKLSTHTKNSTMRTPITKYLFLIGLSLIICSTHAQELPRELRGVWVATVLNIDWPSKAGLKPKAQKEEIDKQLDYFENLGFNAIFFQIRPNSNRLYRGTQEPWAEWLSGKQGKGPWYDPLKSLIQASHKRGMELHAWINPYRVLLDSSKVPKSRKNLVKKHPEWIVHYGKGAVLDPGIPAVRTYIAEIIGELLQRYDLDGIHYDDYFYPYPYKGMPFPDEATFKKYGSGFENKADWRRNNVDALIKATNNAIISNRPRVKFGVSPFGVWRNIASDSLGSETRAGAPTFDSLYTDTRKWLQNGWVDYIAPQLYWSIGFAPAAYEVLANWWADNAFNRHILIGQAAYKVNNNYDSAWYNPSEIPNQIRLNRSLGKKIKGSIYFSAKQVIKNPNHLADSLKTHFYKEKALPPVLSWKPQQKSVQPNNLKIKEKGGKLMLKWKQPQAPIGLTEPAYYAICIKQEKQYKIIKVLEAKKKKAFIDLTFKEQPIEVIGLNKHFN